MEECQKVLEVLQVYEMSSGQQLNKAKPLSSLVSLLKRRV